MTSRALTLLGIATTLLAPLAAGCAVNQDSDEATIRSLLNSSGYTNESNEQSHGSEDTTLAEGGEGLDTPGTIPFVRFRRHIPRGGISRQLVIDIPAYPGGPDTTALATITSDITGEFRTMFDTTSNPILVWRKSLHDQAVRTVYLTKGPDGWRIRKVSPLHFSTVDPAYELNITEFKVHAASWAPGDTFILTSPDTLLAKHDLPTFEPEDEVTVWITVASTGDSCWTFLHHGRPHRPFRWRRTYFKTTTYSFQRTWHLSVEGYEQPQIRPSGHDVIGWNTLWSDTTEPYVSTAWGLPYIVMEQGSIFPEE